VYCAALELDPDGGRASAWRDETLPQHLERADFVFLVARDGTDVVGLVYGYTGTYGQWWTDRVAPAMDEATRREWLDPLHFELCELHVRPDRQRQGIGTRLLDEILERQPHDRAVLSAIRDDPRAQAFYAARGWRPLAEVEFGDEYRPYLVLGKTLR
jgi:ribosomal protein S18 acetylase RimI-like enzyme